MHNDNTIVPVVLAGGLGTRLNSVLSGLPKVLAPVKGKPFITYIFDKLLHSGFKEVILCTGFKSNLVEKTLKYNYNGLAIKYSIENKPLGTGGAIKLASKITNSKLFLIINGDSLCSANLINYIDNHIRDNAVNSLLLTKVDNSSRYGSVEIDEENNIKYFIEKSINENRLINAGVYILNRHTVINIPCDIFYSLENDLFPKLISKNFKGYFFESSFIDIGVPESYHLANHINISSI